MRSNLFIRLLNIRNDELLSISLLLLFSFFMGIALTFFFTVSISSFLVNFDSEMLPYAYLLSGVSGYVIWAIYQYLGRKLRFSKLISITLIFLFITVSILTVANLFNTGKWLSMILLVWVSPFLFIKNVCFWGMASKLFNISQGKRLFGIINSGEVISNIIGFFSIPFLLRILNTTGLLCISIASVFLCVILVFLIVKKYGSLLSNRNPRVSGDHSAEQSNTPGKDNFYLLAVAFSIFPVFVFYFIDYIFLSSARTQINSVELLARFMGFFLGAVSIAELLLKSFVFSKILKHYGVKTGLLSLSSALVFSTLLAVIASVLWTDPYLLFSIVALSKLLERSISNGIHAPSVQLIYQPVSSEKRTGFQSKVEGISGAIGNIAAGGIILLLSAILKITDLTIYNYILLFVLMGWLAITKYLYMAYKEKLSEALVSKKPFQPVKKLSAKAIFTKGLYSANAGLAAISLKLLNELEPKDRFLSEKTTASLIAGDKDYLLRLDTDRSDTNQDIIYKLSHSSVSGQEFANINSTPPSINTGLRSYLLELLSSPLYSNIAANLIVGYKNELLSDLEMLFSKTRFCDMQLKILDLYTLIGTREAQGLLLNKLEYPDREVQMSAIRALYFLNYTPGPAERFEIKQKITGVVGIITWLSASILDLENNGIVLQLIKSLKAEKKEYLNLLYSLLSFIYGYSTIELIRNNLNDKNNMEAHIYALEVTSNTFEEEIQAITYPLFENLSLEKSFENLKHFFPQQKLSIPERAIDILYKDYSKIDLWTKANALKVLGEYHQDEAIRSEIIACLFHKSQIIYETAFALLLHNSAEAITGLTMPPAKFKILKDLFMEKPNSKTIFDKVLLLKKTPLFHICMENKLMPIAHLFDFKEYSKGSKIPAGNLCLINLSGTLTLYSNHEVIKICVPHYTFIQGIHPEPTVDYLVAEEDSTALVCDKSILLNHLFDEPGMCKSLLKYAAEDIEVHSGVLVGGKVKGEGLMVNGE